MKTINFKKISITNFLSFGKTQEYEFENGITLVCGRNKDRVDDPNGCGKSTIFDALSFALFGKTMKSLTTSNLVNRIAKKNGVVRLDMEVDGKPFAIIRGVKPSFAKVEEDGKEKQFAGIKPTDEYISTKIGTDYTTFRNTVMMTSNNTPPFLQQNAETKRKFIESLFNIEFVREMANLLKDENAQKMQEYKEVGMQISSAEVSLDEWKRRVESDKERIASNIKRCEESLSQYREQYNREKEVFDALKEPPEPAELEVLKKKAVDEWKDAEEEAQKISTDISFFVREISSKEATKSQKESWIATTEDWVARVNQGLKDRHIEGDVWEMFEKYEQYGEESVNLGKEQTARATKIESAKEKIADIERQKSELLSGDKCPTCGHVFTEEEKADLSSKAKAFDEKIIIANNYIKQLGVEIQELKLKQDDVARKFRVGASAADKHIDEIESWRKDVERLDGEIKEAEGKKAELDKKYSDAHAVYTEAQKRYNEVSIAISNAVADKRLYEEKRNHIDTLKGFVDSAESALKTAKEEKSDAGDKVSEYETKLEDLRKTSGEIEFDLEAYGCAKKVLGDDGYRAELVGRIVAALNNKANEYLSKLDAPVTIAIDKYFADNIVDITTGETVEYDSLSGGEQRRVDLAMLLAFMDIRSMQGDAKFSTLFFDEILDSALSQQACERLMGILKEKLDEDGTNSVVITHRKELLDNDLVNGKVMVTKLGGVSSIEKL